MNSTVEINGNVTYHGVALAHVPILLSYCVSRGNWWNGLTTIRTDRRGSFSAVWLPSDTVNYLLRGTFNGNANYSKASTIINFDIMPLEKESTFSVTSNSALSAFAFNSTTDQIAFNMTSSSGTTGYANVGISKGLIADTSNLQVFVDGAQTNYSVQQQPNLSMISLTYNESTHQIVMDLNSAISNSSSGGMFSEKELGYVITAAIAGSIIAISLILLKGKQKKHELNRASRIENGGNEPKKNVYCDGYWEPARCLSQQWLKMVKSRLFGVFR